MPTVRIFVGCSVVLVAVCLLPFAHAGECIGDCDMEITELERLDGEILQLFQENPNGPRKVFLRSGPGPSDYGFECGYYRVGKKFGETGDEHLQACLIRYLEVMKNLLSRRIPLMESAAVESNRVWAVLGESSHWIQQMEHMQTAAEQAWTNPASNPYRQPEFGEWIETLLRLRKSVLIRHMGFLTDDKDPLNLERYGELAGRGLESRRLRQQDCAHFDPTAWPSGLQEKLMQAARHGTESYSTRSALIVHLTCGNPWVMTQIDGMLAEPVVDRESLEAKYKRMARIMYMLRMSPPNSHPELAKMLAKHFDSDEYRMVMRGEQLDCCDCQNPMVRQLPKHIYMQSIGAWVVPESILDNLWPQFKMDIDEQRRENNWKPEKKVLALATRNRKRLNEKYRKWFRLSPLDSITAKDLEGKSLEELAWMRNEIFARASHRFKNEPYKSYFENQLWYWCHREATDKYQFVGHDRENYALFAKPKKT